MECSKWEEMGLLYSSGELTRDERTEFIDHSVNCSFCSEENARYLREKELFYNSSMLEETPSAACDAEILRVCADGRKRVSSFTPFPLVVKKAALSLALFILGFSIVGYVTLRMDTSSRQDAASIHEQEVDRQRVASHLSAETAETLQGDSTTDTTPKSNVNFARTRGNLDLKGVVPVDLQNK